MWLHILKKDLKLHWTYLAAVLALKIVSVCMILRMGIFVEPVSLMLLYMLTDLAFVVVAGLAIIVVVQSDPVISNHDDWLTRPIRRSDLALAKIAFAALVTIVPTVAFDLGVGLIHGLDALPAIHASAYLALVIFIALGLPALAIGTITASWLQAAGIVFVVFLMWIAGLLQANIEVADFGNGPIQLALMTIFVIAGALILACNMAGGKRQLRVASSRWQQCVCLR